MENSDKQMEMCYWPFVYALVHQKWKEARPLQKFIMINTYPLWNESHSNFWKTLLPEEKKIFLNIFWNTLEAYVVAEMRKYENGYFNWKRYKVPWLWMQRPPLWKALRWVLPWQYLLKEVELESLDQTTEVRISWYLDCFAEAVYKSAKENRIFEGKTFRQIATEKLPGWEKGPINELHKIKNTEEFKERVKTFNEFLSSVRTYVIGEVTLHSEEKYKLLKENKQKLLNESCLTRVSGLMLNILTNQGDM